MLVDSPTIISPIRKRIHRQSEALRDAVTQIVSKETDGECKRLPLQPVEQAPGSAPSLTKALCWSPSKRVVVAALLDAFGDDGGIPSKSIAVNATVNVGNGSAPVLLCKLMAKRAADLAIQKHGEQIRASGELRQDQLDNPVRLSKALARAAFDTLAFLYERARMLCEDGSEESEAGALLQLHHTEQRLVGPSSRGCGVVYCAKGRAVFQRARAEAAATVQIG